MKFIHKIIRLTRSILSLAFLLTAGLALSCLAGEPENVKYDSIQRRDTVTITDQPQTGCPTPPTLAAPLVSSPPTQSTTTLQPIRGTAAGASLVTAQTDAGSATPAQVGSNGSFCIEVQLKPDQANTIKLTGRDSRGCPGLSTTVFVTHKTVVQPDAGIVTPVNVAKGQTVTSLDAPSKGQLSAIVDENTSTSVEISFMDWDWGGTCDKCTWIKVDLGKSYSISKFRVKWATGADSDYALCYTFLGTTSASAPAPDCSTNTGWTLLHQETTGIPVPNDITIQPATARYVAFLMFENAGAWLWETFQLAELEIWGKDVGSTLPPQPDRCVK